MTTAADSPARIDARPDVTGLLDAFAGLRVLVVGDVILDAYLDGRASDLSREAPVPVVAVRGRTEAPGGAANVAVNLAALGADVRLISVVGRDDAGQRLLELVGGFGVDVAGVVATEERSTVAKRRVLAEGQMLVRFDEGMLSPLAPHLEGEVRSLLRDGVAAVDAVVVADYGSGVMTDGVIKALAATRSPGSPPIVVDAKEPRRYRRARTFACTPNFEEARAALGGLAPAGGDRARAVGERAQRLLDVTGVDIAAVTLDRDGAVLLERDHAPHRIYTDPVPERCSAGAGDTFTAAFALGLAAGGDPAGAAEVAAAAAAVVVAKPGTATCSPAELRLRLLPGGKLVPDAARLAIEGERHRREGRRVVFTNGCFDILHRGHIALLNAAKELGDVLVVALNADASVRRLKGPERPINSLADRVEVLAALSCVDHLVAFDEDRPEELLRALRPDVVVKGGDYSADTVPEAPLVRALGAELRILAQLPERSTTRIVERLRPHPT
ncbi:MAG: D-glycero-beta-D-manno-heptose 1-phosphate adenylyltransferase [Actinobacteria bacterium]|nr:D-glycero-beta-D-manno-heptose 1-phosphate adenylyltransferase [Actinomycetota bacterium]